MKPKRFCPECKSEDVKLELGNLYGTPGIWICNKCGYHNLTFPIKNKSKNKNDAEKI